ncbi:MAG: helix-turn-helix domain-containing protein [Nitrospira sp.]|nr:helix-turn-helix domain-containing protein [Nitrospira sp.]MBA3754230.1 helix-turn-helix domain-containing protein [Nitrospira sp.]
MTSGLKNELLTVTETCRHLNISPRTLSRYIQDRHLPGFKLGKEWRFVRTDLERWLQDHSGPISRP